MSERGWPDVVHAEGLLRESESLNPGPWGAHSRAVAAAARAIAEADARLDPERAYVLGLLHDIGRRSGGRGVADVRHVLDGYAFMQGLGFEESARICLTHSFPIKHVDAFASPWVCPPEEKQFVQEYIDRTEYSVYDRLIQLCDCLGEAGGFTLVERRFVEVALRHGFNALTLDKWRAYLEIRRQFDEAVGGSVYRLLPGVIERTFGL